MKRILLCVLCALFATTAFAQNFPLSLKAKTLKAIDIYKKGTELEFVGLRYVPMNERTKEFDPSSGKTVLFEFLVKNDYPIRVYRSHLKQLEFEENSLDEMWQKLIVTQLLPYYSDHGFMTDLRRENEEEALGYLNKLSSMGLQVEDPHLESYIYGLLHKILPKDLPLMRETDLNVFIAKDLSMCSYVYPNGTILLNTGLLASLHNEDELVAVLAQGVVHYVLDHDLKNIRRQIQRQKRAAFWGALLTGVTAGVEIAAAANGSYSTPGLATSGMAILTLAIASEVATRLGLNYDPDQIYDADRYARAVLGYLGYDNEALASVDKILKSNNELAVIGCEPGYVPARIDPNFERMMSGMVSQVAAMKYAMRRFSQCMTFVDQNIENGVATATDYLLKAHCLLNTDGSCGATQQALGMVARAKEVAPNLIDVHRTEIIAVLRLGDRARARELLAAYRASLLDANSRLMPDGRYEVREKELDWVRDMLLKLD